MAAAAAVDEALVQKSSLVDAQQFGSTNSNGVDGRLEARRNGYSFCCGAINSEVGGYYGAELIQREITGRTRLPQPNPRDHESGPA